MNELEPFLKEFEPSVVANALKGIIRRKLTVLRRTEKKHSNHKQIDAEIVKYEALDKRITSVFPDTRIYKE